MPLTDLLDELADPEEIISDEGLRDQADEAAALSIGTRPPGDGTDDPVTNITQGEGFDEIQNAVDDAEDGDTIQLNDPEFEEDLTINVTNLTIEASADTTIIGVVTIEASGVRIADCEFAPDESVDEIVSVATDANEVEIDGCSFSGTADAALIFEGDNGDVFDCNFEQVDLDNDEHVLVICGDDVSIQECVFLINSEVEAVLVEATDVDIKDCDFEAVEATVTRFIVVVEEVEGVNIIGCVFEGEIKHQAICLRGADSEIRDCDFEDVSKVSTETSIILVTGSHSSVKNCIFVVTDADGLDSVVLVENAEDVDIDDCDFKISDDNGITIKRFVFVRDTATNIYIIDCMFVGVVNTTIVEHNGSGDDSEIRNCEFDDVDLEGEATLIIRVNNVDIEEVDVRIVEIEIDDGFEVFSSISEAAAEADSGDEIVAEPGRYNEDVTLDLGISLFGPNRNSDESIETRDPEDDDDEAIIEGQVAIEGSDFNSDTEIGGVTVTQDDDDKPAVTANAEGSGSGITISDTIVNGSNSGPGIELYPDVDGFGVETVSVEDSLIQDTTQGVTAFDSVEEDDSMLTTFEIQNNIIENADTGIFARGTEHFLLDILNNFEDIEDNTFQNNHVGIELDLIDNSSLSDSLLNTALDNNEFIGTDPEIIPEPSDDPDIIVTENPDADLEFMTLSEIFDGDPSPADEVDASTILVEPGQYDEADNSDGGVFEIDQPGLTITSQAGPEETLVKNISSMEIGEQDITIEGIEFTAVDGEAPIFITADDTVLTNIEMSDFPGNGVLVGGDVDSVTIQDSVISGDDSGSGSDVEFETVVSFVNGDQPDSGSEIAHILFGDNNDIGTVRVGDDKFTPDGTM